MKPLQQTGPQAIMLPVSPQAMAGDVAQLPCETLLIAMGAFDVFLADASQLPNVLPEIGRLREVAFRNVGEGTGSACDIDLYDRHYQHLFVWNRTTHEVVGAYRIGFTKDILQRQGVQGLYTFSLFDFDAGLFDRLGPCLELGRSFVNPSYQGNTRALRLLWAGIAMVLNRHPNITHLFGPVSVSPRFSELGRMLIMSALQLHHMDAGLKSLIRPRNAPLHAEHPLQERVTEVSAGLADAGKLSRFLQRLERGLALPMLIKHYIELKGRFAGFNVDHAFNGTLDGLVFVRTQDIPVPLRARLTGQSTKKE